MPADHQHDLSASARATVARALADAAEFFPELPPTDPPVAKLDPRDARLVMAIHRGVLQRWITLEHLLNLFLSQSSQKLEPTLRAILLSGAAQLLLMDRLPRHAVVDESVQLAKRMVRPGAGGIVNAVLRRLSDLIGPTVRDQPWTPACDRLPVDGGFVMLSRACLPPLDPLDAHLAIVTSHPRKLVQRWIQTFGVEHATQLCLHSVITPPVIVAVEPGFDKTSLGDAAGSLHPHQQPGFFLWNGPHDRMVAFLAGHAQRRVQDPASSLAIGVTESITPPIGTGLILDYCAGRGTKTRQLAAAHPNAQIIAHEPDGDRRSVLGQTFAGNERVTVVSPRDLPAALNLRAVDLLVLDVPCSNSAVLARRPEARYRMDVASLSSVASLQRKIIEEALPLLAPGGHVLYSTCSLEDLENQAQARWIAKHFAGTILHQSTTLPAGQGDSYHDGGYAALIRTV
jgi:16S rRNA (cytosine967-C5)-methyltransferase